MIVVMKLYNKIKKAKTDTKALPDNENELSLKDQKQKIY